MRNSEDTTSNSSISIGENKVLYLGGKKPRGDFIDITIPPEGFRTKPAGWELPANSPISTSPQIELTSKHQLLTCLGLAIDEAKLVRSLIESKDRAGKLKQNDPFSKQLVYLNKEINYLEVKLTQVRRTASGN
jgi:hypothetical protein